MKKNQARKFACKVKKELNRKLKYGINPKPIVVVVKNVEKYHLNLQKISLIETIEYKNPYYILFSNLHNCLLFLEKYNSLPRNLYDTNWIK